MWFDDAVSNEKDAPLAQRLNHKVYHLGVLVVLLYFLANSFRPVLDNVDLGWHVAQGRWMVERGAIYRHDVLNYATFGRPLINEYPFFQIALYLATELGWWGPCLLTAAAYAILIGALARAAKAFHLEGSAPMLATFATTILYLLLAFPLRPHLVTYLGVILSGIFLLRHREARSWTEFWPLALGQIIWTNSHSAFVLGPLMAGLFGLEMTLRRGIRDRAIPWEAARTWGGVFLLILLACFVNPFGVARFYPPFYQDRLESIRAYVSEMRPLPGGFSTLYGVVTLFAVATVILAAIRRRGAISYSLILPAIPLFLESQSVQKAWPVFGLFFPLLVLSTGAFSSKNAARPASWPSLAGNFIVTAGVALFFLMRVNGSSSISLQVLWREYDLNRREVCSQAAVWMKAHGIEGRLLHRCEDGGMLQEAGYDQGETFGDTGFGKYDENFIHTISLLSARPALLPRYLQAYRPDYIVCGNFCYEWPYYLRQSDWRPIFYSPNSSVWTRPETRPDLPTINDGEIEAAFDQEMTAHGHPVDLSLFGRDILALDSMGLEDFAFLKLTSLPADLHRTPWYWEAARILCFTTPRFSEEHRHQFLAEADRLHDDSLTAEFRAYARDAAGDPEAARQILAALPPDQLGSHALDLLLGIDLEQNRPEALVLAERKRGFELGDGLYWEYVAQAETRAGHQTEAAHAWKKAVFFYPDDADLMRKAGEFAIQFHDTGLAREIESGAIIGPAPRQD